MIYLCRTIRDGSIMRANKIDGSETIVLRDSMSGNVRDLKVFHKDKQKGKYLCYIFVLS